MFFIRSLSDLTTFQIKFLGLEFLFIELIVNHVFSYVHEVCRELFIFMQCLLFSYLPLFYLILFIRNQ